MANYLNITTDECRISRDSLLMDNNCFSYHKIDNTVNTIFNGRRANAAEVPWHVFINVSTDLFYMKCGGSILNEWWILTAAHCVACIHNLNCTITIYPGTLNISDLGIAYKPKRIIIHKGFAFNQSLPDDIALIELNTALDLTASKGSHYRRVNSVCLPKADIYNTRKEYALVAGFGRINKTHFPDWLQMGWVGLIPASFILNDWSTKMIMVQQFNDSSSMCGGDSGGGLIQWQNGRAIVIGILSWGSGCGYRKQTRFVRTSLKVNWINEQINGI